MRRVCSCNPAWVKYYHEDMGWGLFVERPCTCGCPWRHGKCRPEWPPGVFDHVSEEYEPCVRPMDALRAEGYSDDPEIVDNPWQVGLFFGAPQLRANQSRTLFPRTAPRVHYVSFGVPASSTGPIRNHYPFSSGIGDWRQEDLTKPVVSADDRAEDDSRGGDDESARPRTSGEPGREYPAGAQVVHREGPRESAGYAYRGTIVGEASNPGPVDLTANCRGSRMGACDYGGWPGVGELRTVRDGAGGEALAGPMGRSSLSGRGGTAARDLLDSSAVCGECVHPPRRTSSP